MKSTTALAGATLALASLGLTAATVGASPGTDRAVTASGPTYVHQRAFAGTDVDGHVVTTASGSTNVTLRLSGLPEAVRGTSLGAHVHTKPCGPLAADSGGHYQDPGAAPGTPLHDREVWLDVDVNPAGNAQSSTSADFAVVPGARSVVLHAMPTNHHDGTAGARLLCVDVPFDVTP